MPSRPTLYVRHGCHLCEDASVLLDDMLGTSGWDAVDIDTDDELLLRYGRSGGLPSDSKVCNNTWHLIRDAVNQRVAAVTLEQRGFHVHLANDGREAHEVLARTPCAAAHMYPHTAYSG